MRYRINPAPGWPSPPPNWTPPKGWKPDPAWPPPPPGWQLWVPVGTEEAAAAPAPTHARAASLGSPTASTPAGPATSTAEQTQPKIGLFGARKRALAAEQELAELRAWRDQFEGKDAIDVARIVQAQRDQLAGVEREIAEALSRLAVVREEVASAQVEVVETQELALLQEVGIYEYRHPLTDAVAYKSALADLKAQIKVQASGSGSGGAVLAATNWSVNGSASQGRKMVKDFSKLMLRAYNAEADNCVRTLKPHTLPSAVDRLSKVRETIARLGKTMDIRISDPYHRLRVRELELTADYLTKVEEERERVRAERERQREEERAQREFEREKARLLKEQGHYAGALEKLIAKGDETGAAELRVKLEEIASAIRGVESREANIRAGHVYVISNIGAFGDKMIKIGMTRRLEPMDRVRELGDASVPFKFDVHALIFSEDAVGLETALHQRLSESRVNRVNTRREFFYATVGEVREVLAEIAGQHLLEYNDLAEAVEWRASGGPSRRLHGAERRIQPFSAVLKPAGPRWQFHVAGHCRAGMPSSASFVSRLAAPTDQPEPTNWYAHFSDAAHDSLCAKMLPGGRS